jgi:hypothetical protein
MKVQVLEHVCVVTKEPGDPRFSGVVNAAGESRLLYHIKKELNKRGYDLIKKRMWKDGHLVDSMQQYLRTRKKSDNNIHDIYIYNGNWNVEGADERLNRDGTVTLTVVRCIFDK